MCAGRLYAYVGPEKFKNGTPAAAQPIQWVGELIARLALLDDRGPVTFVVGRDGYLRLAPRESEPAASIAVRCTQ